MKRPVSQPLNQGEFQSILTAIEANQEGTLGWLAKAVQREVATFARDHALTQEAERTVYREVLRHYRDMGAWQ